ncbi:ABC transporter substrate-binding protein [Phenylobacterium sp.]|uniref:CmpA/NrtA family ABC transporter substrate-binding protein n=1 Tax=Phenylobacterium sp. TaxID=1871053 RepID=UPI0035B26239
MSVRLTLGFVPLVDAAGLIVAQAKGFFAAEGLEVELSREASWATVRDKVAFGALDGAHMLAPMVMARTLGAGGDPSPMIAPLTLATDASAITVSARLGLDVGAGAAGLAGLVARRREMGASPLTFSVVYPYSVHNYLLRLWMAGAGVDPDRDVNLTIAPPPRMADLLAGGVIEGFCAGEPWNSVAVAAGVGIVAARAADIAPGAPDKVLGLAAGWAQGNPRTLAALIRALVRALAWARAPQNRRSLAFLLAEPQYLAVPPDAVAAGLRSVVFSDGRPDPAQAQWLLDQMRRWGQIPADAAPQTPIYRADLYDAALADA